MHLFTVLIVRPQSGYSFDLIRFLLTLFFLDYYLAIVSAAIHAYMVRENRFMTLGTK